MILSAGARVCRKCQNHLVYISRQAPPGKENIPPDTVQGRSPDAPPARSAMLEQLDTLLGDLGIQEDRAVVLMHLLLPSIKS